MYASHLGGTSNVIRKVFARKRTSSKLKKYQGELLILTIRAKYELYYQAALCKSKA